MGRTSSGDSVPPGAGRDFDLNMEKVLDGWEVCHAVRELIANALDEATLSRTPPPTIKKTPDGLWHICDTGRGLRYEHLTQNESAEKRKQASAVIGRFGVGLKDALGVLHRRGVGVLIKSRFGDISLVEHAKASFNDVVTLHAHVADPSKPGMPGTDVSLRGATDDDIKRARHFFLQFSGDKVLETTRYGQILQRATGVPARVYVNGLAVAEENDFAFSYNITSLTEPMRKALNRERTNVGRTAYSDRVKAMLLAAESVVVAGILGQELTLLDQGTSHDEIKWADVQVRACQILSSTGKVVFVTSVDLTQARDLIDHARTEGRSLIMLPASIAERLVDVQDFQGQPLPTLVEFNRVYQASFAYDFVDESTLTQAERAVWQLRAGLANLVGGMPSHVKAVRLSKTMRPTLDGDDVLGCWDPLTSSIIIRRDQLGKIEKFAGTLLHEIAHARSGAVDVSREFESVLTSFLGLASSAALQHVKR